MRPSRLPSTRRATRWQRFAEASRGSDAGVGQTDGMDRPPDDATVDTAWALRWQAEYCRHNGAPTAALVCDVVASDLNEHGPLSALIAPTTRFADWVGLRVMGCVHRLAIERQAPAVAVGAPTLGGTSPLDAPDPVTAVAGFGEAVVAALVDHPDALREAIDRVPQTNEPARARALRIALARSTRPVRLFEVGASAGLNMRADHLPGDLALEGAPQPEVVERRGCDLDPVDPATPAGRTWLSGFVWLDDTARFAALAHALDVAARIPAKVVRADAADFVSACSLAEGTTTVVWHSAFWSYLPPARRAALSDSINALGATASTTAPLWHVSWEAGPTDMRDFELWVERFEGDAPRRELLATGGPHAQGLALA